MRARTRDILAAAVRDLGAAWRIQTITDLAYKAVAIAVLTPATALFLRWLLSRTGSRAVADADVARFFVTTRPGVLALVLGGAMLAAITALELGCLMAIGLATARGTQVSARSALAFAGKRAGDILRLTGHMVLRVIAGLVPFLAAIGLGYFALLRGHDINYFLARKPPEFLIALALGATIVAALAVLLLRTIARWTLALPLLLFEDVHPRRAERSDVQRFAVALLVHTGARTQALESESALRPYLPPPGVGPSPDRGPGSGVGAAGR